MISMKLYTIIKEHLTALTDTVTRYPISTIYLIAIVLIRFLAIENINDQRILYDQLFAALIIGFFLSINIRRLSETFSLPTYFKPWLLYVLGMFLTFGYYLMIRSQDHLPSSDWIRTAVLSFGLYICFLWIATLSKQAPYFYQSFMNGFKALAMSLFFSGVLFLGLALIIAAIDTLLFSIDENLYMHFTTFVFLFFAPLFVLSLIPNYGTTLPKPLEKAIQGTRFLETLLSYIIIPLTVIFTFILFIYIGLNIRGDFWTENLLEPMLVSYSIVGISVLLLSVSFENGFARQFHRIFPKLLIPLVLLQLIASIMKIHELGITHGRYFVILYGIFALVTGIIFSFFQPKHLGIIAICFMLSALISSLPPFDAFTVSQYTQMNLLEDILLENGMLVDDNVLPNPDLDETSKMQIIALSRYAYRMGFLNEFSWIDANFVYYKDFETVFGFSSYERPLVNKAGNGFYYNYNREYDKILELDGYSYLTHFSITYFLDEDTSITPTSFVINNTSYHLSWSPNEHLGKYDLYNDQNALLISIDTASYDAPSYESENTSARLKIIPNNINLYYEDDQLNSLTADMILLIDMK